MADLIVSPLVHLVKQQVVDCLKYQYQLRSGVEGKLKKLEATVNRIEAVANTADEMDLEKHMGLKAWATELKVAAEEAMDVLDKFKYLRLQHQADGDRPPSTESHRSFAWGELSALYKKVTKKIKRFFRSTNPLERLRSIQIKLDRLALTGEQFLLVVIAHQKNTNQEHHKQDGRKQETSSSVVERELVGRKDYLEEIINKLLNEEEPVSDGGSITVPVLPLVGHGGMGKTTLAQHVFNNTRVAEHFDVRMWAYVSQDFHVPTLTRKMIESAAPKQKCSDTESLEALQQKLKHVLKSKSFLLVLDDMWYDNKNKFAMEEKWNKLCSPLAEAGGKGSKILLTSRTPEVKDLPDALTPMNLQGLEQNDCWSIIQRTAFRGSRIPDGCGDLVEIGRNIALKVCGSPLAAKAVGGILRKDLTQRHWSKIEKQELLEFGEKDVMPVLKLSYQYLPYHMRQCFAYCSLFPKGYHFDVDMLIRMWVAHDYIQDRANGEETQEDMGREYFNDLLSAGFFTRQFDEDTVMHDRMHDLARFVSMDHCLPIEHTLPQDCFIPETVRHLSVRTDFLAELIKEGCNLSNLRTLLLFDNGNRYDELDKMLVKQVLLKLQRVRVLDVHGCNLEELPDDISGWEHLRYLDLSCTNIARLPDLISELYHLQVLDIRLTSESFPVKLNKLVNLRFLGPDQHVKMFWLTGLKSIQALRGTIFVENGDVSEMRILKDLNELEGTLVLDNLNQVVSRAAAREADLYNKKRLRRLRLEWQFFPGKSALAVEVLEGLQPPSTLERLEIYNYTSTMCPNWMSNPSSLANLLSICLKNLTEVECLPPLGLLPFLRSVELKYLPRVRKLSQEGFPSLKTLMIEDMKEVEEWTGSEASGGFPCLEKLSITKCPNMRAFPTLSSTVTELDHSDHQEVGSSSNVVIQAPASLKKLKIEKCPALLVETSSISTVYDSKGMATEPFSLAVESLEIDDPLMLIKVPVLKSLTSVRKLKITDASGLISFSHELEVWLLQNGTSLRTLNVENAQKLMSVPKLPNSLEELNIRKTCPEFMKMYERVTGPAWHEIGNIKHIDIS